MDRLFVMMVAVSLATAALADEPASRPRWEKKAARR